MDSEEEAVMHVEEEAAEAEEAVEADVCLYMCVCVHVCVCARARARVSE
jgi:hypothetical protein